MGRWVDVVLGIWWCPDCGEEIWVTEGVDGGGWSEHHGEGVGADGPSEAAVPGVSGVPEDAGDDAGASSDRARADAAAVRAWQLIVDRFGRVGP